MTNSLLLKMAIEIVNFPIENGGSFHSYVSLPEGKSHSLRRTPKTKAALGFELLFTFSCFLQAVGVMWKHLDMSLGVGRIVSNPVQNHISFLNKTHVVVSNSPLAGNAPSSRGKLSHHSDRWPTTTLTGSMFCQNLKSWTSTWKTSFSGPSFFT